MSFFAALHQKRDRKMETAYHFSFVAIAVLLLFTLFNIKYDYYVIAAVEMMTGTCWAALMVAHHHQWLPDALVYHGMISLGFIILTTLLLEGGYGNAGIFWMLGFPFLAYFFAGKRGGTYWSVAFIASFIIIQSLAQNQLIQLSYTSTTLDLIPSILAVFSFFAYSYEKCRDEAMQNEHLALTSLQQEVVQHQEGERALALSQERIKAMMSDMREAVFQLNLEGRITFISPAIQHITHFSPAETRQQTLLKLMCHPEDQQKFHQAIHHYGQVRNFEVELHAADNQQVFASINARLTYNVQREVTGIEGIISDTTQATQSTHAMQLLIEALRQSRDTARTSNQSKANFLALISHELRTPIHGLMGMQEMLMSKTHTLSQEQQDYLQASHQATLTISSLIHDILCMSDKPATQHQSDMVPVSEFFSAILCQQRYLMLEKGLDFQLHLWDMPPYIHSDANQLRQLCLNLLAYIIQHTHTGQIVMHIRQKEQQFELAIHYSGDAMHLEDFKQTHEHVYQQPSSAQPHHLKPLLVQHFIDSLHGKLQLTKEVFEHVVTLHMPLHIPPQHQAQANITQHDNRQAVCQSLSQQPTNITSQQNQHLHILLAEDDKISRMVAEKRLKRAGFAISTAYDGEQAWEMLQSRHFDVLLTDIRMPKLDGLALTKKIRLAEENTAEHIYILGLSAHIMPDDEDRYLNVGMDAVFSKPLQPSKLLQYVQHINQTPTPILSPDHIRS